MATKGTVQYNVWRAKYNLAKLRKEGQKSLFSKEQCDALISAVAKDLPKTKTYNLAYFKQNIPTGVSVEIWLKAAEKATKNGTKEAGFGAVRAISKVYAERLRKEQQEQADYINFCSSRAENEQRLAEMFS